MRRAAPLACFTILAALVACSGPSSDTSGATPPVANTPSLSARNVAQLDGPTSWSGDLPCADCAGIRTDLTLYPDGTFRSRGTYMGAAGPGDTIFTDFGRWTLDDAATRVSVRGSANVPGQFAVDPGGMLRMLDADGQDIASALNYSLSPLPQPITILHPARLVGAFRYMADAASFLECGSGLQYPVDMSGAYQALESAYLGAGVSGGAPVTVRVRAHLDDRPGMDGGAPTLSVIIDSLYGIEPEAECGALRQQDEVAGRDWQLVAMIGDTGPLNVPSGFAGQLHLGSRRGTHFGQRGVQPVQRQRNVARHHAHCRAGGRHEDGVRRCAGHRDRSPHVRAPREATRAPRGGRHADLERRTARRGTVHGPVAVRPFDDGHRMT